MADEGGPIPSVLESHMSSPSQQTSFVRLIANRTMPQSNPKQKKPWISNECKEPILERKQFELISKNFKKIPHVWKFTRLLY